MGNDISVVNESQPCELERHRHGLPQKIRDLCFSAVTLLVSAGEGLAAFSLAKGGAQVTPDDVLQPVKILNGNGVAESKRFCCVFNRRGVRHRAKDHANRIARHETQDGEYTKRDKQDNEQALRKAPGKETEEEAHVVRSAADRYARPMREERAYSKEAWRLPLREHLRDIALASSIAYQRDRTPNQTGRPSVIAVLSFATIRQQDLCRTTQARVHVREALANG
jgi:hypothetical protein